MRFQPLVRVETFRDLLRCTSKSRNRPRDYFCPSFFTSCECQLGALWAHGAPVWFNADMESAILSSGFEEVRNMGGKCRPVLSQGLLFSHLPVNMKAAALPPSPLPPHQQHNRAPLPSALTTRPAGLKEATGRSPELLGHPP